MNKFRTVLDLDHQLGENSNKLEEPEHQIIDPSIYPHQVTDPSLASTLSQINQGKKRLHGVNENVIYECNPRYPYKHIIFVCHRVSHHARVCLSSLAIEEDISPSNHETNLYLLHRVNESEYCWYLWKRDDIGKDVELQDTSSICIKLESVDLPTLRKKCSFYYQNLLLISRLAETFDFNEYLPPV